MAFDLRGRGIKKRVNKVLTMHYFPGGFLRGAPPLERACCPSFARFCGSKKAWLAPNPRAGVTRGVGEPGAGGERETGEWGTGGDEEFERTENRRQPRRVEELIRRVEVVTGRHKSAAMY